MAILVQRRFGSDCISGITNRGRVFTSLTQKLALFANFCLEIVHAIIATHCMSRNISTLHVKNVRSVSYHIVTHNAQFIRCHAHMAVVSLREIALTS